MRRALGVFLIWTISMALLLGLVLGVGQAYRYWTMPVVDEATPLQIQSGQSMRDVARAIQAERSDLPAEVIYWTARFRGQARQIRAGEYEMAPGERLTVLLDRLVAGDVVEYRFTVPEGLTAADFLQRLAEAPRIRRTLDDLSPQAVIEALALPVEHLEGWLYPDTYHYPAGTTDRAIIRQAHALMREQLQAAWEQRADDLPIDSPYEALILASVIEKETAVPGERDRIAGVFVNRLERGMRLQTDPTVIYGLGDDYRGGLTVSQLKRDTPYNTYTRGGLPPTPIALPSRAALIAATQPAQTEALFFVADGTGGHHFSRTLKEHNRAVSRWRAHERGEVGTP